MMKHGEEYEEITDLDVGDEVDEDTFNTLMSGNKPRVVFSEGSLNEGDMVLFKAHTTFLPYKKTLKTRRHENENDDKFQGKDEATFHRWIPGYGAAHSNWKYGTYTPNSRTYRSGTYTWEDVHLEEGELTTKEQDTVDRLEEEISVWAVFSAEKKIDRNVTFETLSGGPGQDHIKFKVDTGESKHGDSKDTVFIMAFGK